MNKKNILILNNMKLLLEKEKVVLDNSVFVRSKKPIFLKVVSR
jgi:hypothetical protein